MNIPRYKINALWGYWGFLQDDLNGKFCEYRDYVKLEAENARLKAEVERLTNQNALATPRHLIASQDIKTLREQIEELKLENSQYEEHHKYGQNVITSLREEVENSKRINTELLALSNRQASDIRRLTKAGDAMASSIQFNEEMAQDYNGPAIVHQSVQRWHAAKEGKQSK